MLRVIRNFILIQMFLMTSTAHALNLFAGDDVIWEKDQNEYIKLEQQDNPVYGANDHPATLNPKIIQQVLASMMIQSDKTRPVFTSKQASLLGEQLANGLKTANASQDIVFSLLRTEKSEIFGLKPNRYFIAGRAFYKLGQLHIIIGDFDRWRNDSAEKAYDPTEVGSYKYKLNHGSRVSSTQDSMGPIESFDGLKNMRFKGVVRNDWIVVDLDRALASFSQRDELRKQKEIVQRRKEILEALGDDAALIAPRAVPAPAPVQKPRTIEDRLMTLKKLQEKGLITDEEYVAKRQQILDSL